MNSRVCPVCKFTGEFGTIETGYESPSLRISQGGHGGGYIGYGGILYFCPECSVVVVPRRADPTRKPVSKKETTECKNE